MGLEARNVTVRFGGLVAIQDVSLTLTQGEIIGLIGPNGAGKTTMVNVLSGFQKPHRGGVIVSGAAVRLSRPEQFVRAGVVRTFQAVRLFPQLSVSENVEVACVSAGASRAQARDRARVMLDYVGLAARAGTRAAELNYGDERRVGLARALALSPRYLLLDEPAAGLNAAEALALQTTIRDIRTTFGCGILLIEHNMTLVMSVCERVHVLSTGRTLASGRPDEILRDAEVRQAYLGAQAA